MPTSRKGFRVTALHQSKRQSNHRPGDRAQAGRREAVGGHRAPTTLKTPTKPRRLGEWQNQIQGRYRPISVHQLAMAWWCYKQRHITKRQLRIYFAAHAMHECRRYTQDDPDTGRPRQPLYGLPEIRALIGSKDSKSADAAISADVKAIGRLGLVKITPHAIDFAMNFVQLNLPPAPEDVASESDNTTSNPHEDNPGQVSGGNSGGGGFWGFYNELPNNKRSVPVPRRTVRALAAGFQGSVMGVMIGLMIRGLFWHRRDGAYRVDGRTKTAWFSEHFMLSARSVTEARARLVELGWLSELDTPQWLLNKYGKHERINVEAFGPEKQANSATPSSDKTGESASPCLNTSSSSMNLKTRKTAPMRAGTVWRQ